MPRVTLIQTNFTAGEVSPKCYGRTDVERYRNGAKSLENCIVGIHGGAMRRPGTKYIANAKYSDKAARLVPFVFSRDQAYMLEFGENYIRVYLAAGGQVLVGGSPYEIATPYTAAMLAEMDYTQGADTMFIFHKDVLINTLTRYASDRWVLKTAPFTVLPFDEIGHTFSASLTLSAATVGSGRTATASASTFLAADVGRRITAEGGSATITAYSSATAVTCEITAAFSATALAAADWTLQDSPQAYIKPSAKDPVGASITLSLYSDAGATTTVAGWRSEDVGKFVRINGGLVKLTTFTSTSAMSGLIEEELSSDVAAAPNSWSLEASVWNATNGYPRTGVLHEQRLVAAGTPKFPQTIWGTKSGLYYDFTLGDVDDDAFAFVLPSTGQVNPITRMASVNSLIPLTYGGEFTIAGGVEKPLTPTNSQIKSPSVHGCNNVKPVRVGGELLFVQRSGRKLRAFSYKPVEESYASPDLTVLAEHITESGIVDMAYQQEPGSIVWCVRADGKIAAMTLDRDEGVIAWTPQSTDGLFESIATIPNGTADEVWILVNRTIGGTTKRYIERFDSTLLTDCAITGTSVGGTSTWAGLNHLEGKAVCVVADGSYIGQFTVSGGQIEINRNAYAVQIGLPYTNTVELLRPEVQAGDATAQGNNMRTSEVSLLFHETIGAKVNGDALTTRTFGGDLLDEPPPEFSGYNRIGITGWYRGDSPIVITQDEPLPFHLLAVVRKFTVNS